MDKLTLVAIQQVRTIRDGKLQKIRSSKLVRDDIVEFVSGDQICADGILRAGTLQVNESLVTGEEDAIGSLVEDVRSPEPQQAVIRQEMMRLLEGLLSQLPERQQRVLRLRFGMDDGVCHSLEKIGAMLGVSKERARQIEHQAMDKLQKLGASLGLEDFLE